VNATATNITSSLVVIGALTCSTSTSMILYLLFCFVHLGCNRFGLQQYHHRDRKRIDVGEEAPCDASDNAEPLTSQPLCEVSYGSSDEDSLLSMTLNTEYAGDANCQSLDECLQVV
jgi:hypothetical protein